MQTKKESKKWQHTTAIELFEKAKVIIVSLDGIHLAINNSETTRRLFNKHNLRERTGRKIQEIIENEFIELPENPTATFGKLYIRKEILWELIPIKEMIETSKPIDSLFDFEETTIEQF